MLEAIDRRTHNEFASEASLHGIKIPLRHNQESEQVEMDSVDPEFAERALRQAQERVKSRYGK